MKIVNAESRGYNPAARDILKTLGDVVEADADYEELVRLVADADILIVRLRNRIDGAVFRAAPRLKAIVTATTGLDHIDLDSAVEYGVVILSLRGETDFLSNITATAELAWGLILALARRITSANNHVLSGGWDRDSLRGIELKDKILGIVGLGRVGNMVAEYGRTFRMQVLATDPAPRKRCNLVVMTDLGDLVRRSHVVTVHAPLNESTYHMFNNEMFSCFRCGSIFVNTSRGEIVDEEALVEALSKGILAGAGLDVLAGESSGESAWMAKNPLLSYARRHDNVVLTPHIGGATFDSMWETELFMARKLANYLREVSPDPMVRNK